MKHGRILTHTALGLAVSALAACSSGGDDSGITSTDGSLTLDVTDASVDNVQEIWVEFTGVRLQPQDGDAIDITFDTPISVDMLTLTGGNSESLLNGEPVPAGTYDWMALQVNAEFDSELDSYVMTDAGGQEEIQVPSGSQQGLRLVSPFTITADQETSFLIDWDMRMGLVNPDGQPGFLLRPAFRLIDMTEFGTLSGTIAMNHVTDDSCTNDLSADTGNAVYIYAEFDTSADDPDDIDGSAGPTPEATATVEQDADGDYVYETILSPGDYTVAFTCQAADDSVDTDEDIAFVLPSEPGITITDGETSTVDF